MEVDHNNSSAAATTTTATTADSHKSLKASKSKKATDPIPVKKTIAKKSTVTGGDTHAAESATNAEVSEQKAKRHKKRNNKSLKSYIHKIVKDESQRNAALSAGKEDVPNSGEFAITAKSIAILEGILADKIAQVASRSGKIAQLRKVSTINEDIVKTAIRSVFPSIADRLIREGEFAVSTFRSRYPAPPRVPKAKPSDTAAATTTTTTVAASASKGKKKTEASAVETQ